MSEDKIVYECWRCKKEYPVDITYNELNAIMELKVSCPFCGAEVYLTT